MHEEVHEFPVRFMLELKKVSQIQGLAKAVINVERILRPKQVLMHIIVHMVEYLHCQSD